MAKDIFLIPIPPQQLRSIQGWNAQPAHLAYRVGRGPHLFRAGGSVPLRGGVMVVDGQGYDGTGPIGPFCQEMASECALRGFSGAVLDFDRRLPPLEQLAGQLDRLFAQRGLQLYVPEAFGHCVAHGRVILSSALSGGSLAQRLEEWGRRGIVTARAARDNRGLLTSVAPERVREELTKLLCGQNAGRVLEDYAPVAAQVLPEIAPTFGFDQRNPWHDKDVWRHTLAAVDAAPADPVLRWAALLHDLGKPPCFTLDEKGVGHFYDHGEESARLAGNILSRLRFDTDTRRRIVALVALHDRTIIPERRPVRRLLARLGPEGTADLIALHRADNAAQSSLAAGRQSELDRAKAVLDRLLAEGACFQKKDLAVNGRDMLELGLKGPEIGQALDRCLEAVLSERLPNEKAALLELVRR